MHGSKLCRLCPDGAFEAHARAAPPGAHRTTRGCGLLWASAAGKKRRKPAGLGDASTRIEAIRATAAEATRGTVCNVLEIAILRLELRFQIWHRLMALLALWRLQMTVDSEQASQAVIWQIWWRAFASDLP
jgi:hypothetical protein